MKTRYLVIAILPLLLASCSRRTEATSQSTSIISTSQTTSTSSVQSEIDVSFVAINDFHGIVDGRNSNEVGLKKMTTYLKNKKNSGCVLINSGDSFQGSFIAGYDQGEMISDVFNYIDFDAYTIGNHEFDWGIDAIRNQELVLGKKYLGANIYTYPQKKKADLGELYTTKILNEGQPNQVKVGIIGVLGEDQITSIVSTSVSDLIFVNPTPIIESLSIELRTKQNCDIVIADYHASYEQVDTEIANYVDAVFLGHSHQNESYVVNGVPFLQAESYGKAAAEVTLTFNKTANIVKTKNYKIENLRNCQLEDDNYATTLIDNIKVITDPIGTQIIGTSSSYLNTEKLACYYSKLAYEKAVNLGYNVDFVLFNSARYSLQSGQFDYASLYETNPFHNALYIISTNGKTIYREACNFARQFGYNPNETTLSTLQSQSNVWYDVLVYDYNGFHINIDQNGDKYYDYFAASFTGAEKHEPIFLEDLDVIDLAVDALEKNPTIQSSDYSGNKFICN